MLRRSKGHVSFSLSALATASSGDGSSPMNFTNELSSTFQAGAGVQCCSLHVLFCPKGRAQTTREHVIHWGWGERGRGGVERRKHPPGKSLPVFAASLTWSSSHPSHEVTEHWKGVTLNREVPSTHWSSEDSEQQQKKKKKKKRLYFFLSF